MREILFRGKRADIGKWVEGDVIHDLDLKKYFIAGYEYYPGENKPPIKPFMYDVIPETVGQYTGLEDKNGKKIFEGDSLSITFRRRAKKPFEMHGTVIWEEETAAFSVEGFFDSSPQFLCDIVEDSEVIGNIHDNPELYNLV